MDYTVESDYYTKLIMSGGEEGGGGEGVDGESSWDILTTTMTSPAQTSRVLGLYDIFIPLLGAFIIVLNLAVVVSSGLILKKGQQPRSTYLFLGNVGLTDLLTGFAVLFGQFYPRQYRDEISCAVQIGMIVSATVTSVYSVGLIAIDRFLYILHGLQYQRWIYPNRARLLILITWIIGIVIGFLPAFGWRGDTENGRRCWFILVAPPELVLLTSILGILPILVVVVLYSIILHHALRKVIQLKRAARNYAGVSGVAGNLRMHVGSGAAATTSTTSSTVAAASSSMGNTDAVVEMSHKISFDNNANGGGRSVAALSDTEEPLQPKKKKRGGFFNFLSRQDKTPTAAVPSSASTSAAAAATNNESGFHPPPPAPRPPPQPTPARANKSLSKWKAIKVVLFTTGSFVVTWVPYFIASCMYVNCDWSVEPDRCRNLQIAIASPLAILGFANSLTNPIIYAWWHNGFRESAKAIICGAACRKRRTSESDGPSSTTQSTGRTTSSAEVRGRRWRSNAEDVEREASSVSRRGGAGAEGGDEEEGVGRTTKSTTTTSKKNGNNGMAFATSTTTMNVSTTDVELSDADGSSDVESALRRRGGGGGGGDWGDPKQWQREQSEAAVGDVGEGKGQNSCKDQRGA